jgi:hypothetical protein
MRLAGRWHRVQGSRQEVRGMRFPSLEGPGVGFLKIKDKILKIKYRE